MPTGSMTRMQPRASDGLPVMTSSPGYLIRRAQQVHVSLWQKHIKQNLTSVQYGVLLVLGQRRAIDQTSVAELMSLDKNTAADVLRRLRNRGVVARERDPADGRRWLTQLTDVGMSMLLRAAPAVLEVQDRILDPLSTDEAETVLRLLCAVAYRGDPPSVASSAATTTTTTGWPPRLAALQLHTAPGHLVRRSQQLHTLLWTEEVSADLTSVQYSVLLVLHRESSTDQGALGRHAHLDKATGTDVVSRMQDRGLINRGRDETDGRRYRLSLSAKGLEVLRAHAGGVQTVQRRLMEPLSKAERRTFASLMTKLVNAAED
jgi:MarR family transcriptional regulator, lower aerobic nicotinate degradation pathway regulator